MYNGLVFYNLYFKPLLIIFFIFLTLFKQRVKCIEYSSEIFSRWLGHKRAGAGAKGARGGEGSKRAWGNGVRCFCIPTTSECKKFK